MGCVTSFIYKSEHYEHILWYSEQYDVRFGNIYVKKTQENLHGFILKRIHKKEKEKFVKNMALIAKVFEIFPEFILQISNFQGHMVKVASSHEQKLKLNEHDHIYMKIEYFEKDLNDDVNVKALKNRYYEDDEIWNIIYFAVFVFAQLENSNIPIPKIERKNFVIKKKKLKYYLQSIYQGNVQVQNLNEQDRKFQFLAKLQEFNYVLLSTINIQKYHQSLASSLEELVDKAREHISEKLYDFINEILIHNKKGYKSFQELRQYLVFLFPTFHSLFFDPVYINIFDK